MGDRCTVRIRTYISIASLNEDTQSHPTIHNARTIPRNIIFNNNFPLMIPPILGDWVLPACSRWLQERLLRLWLEQQWFVCFFGGLG